MIAWSIATQPARCNEAPARTCRFAARLTNSGAGAFSHCGNSCAATFLLRPHRRGALLSIGWGSFFQIQDQRQNSAYHKHDRDQQHRRLPVASFERLWPAPRTTQLVGASEALGLSVNCVTTVTAFCWARI